MAGPAAGAKAAAAPCTAVVAAALPGGPQPPCPALASRSGPHPGCRAENNARGCVRFPGRKREAPTNVVWIRRRHGLEGGTATGRSARPRCAPDGIRPPPSPHGHGLPAPRASSAVPEPWPRSSSSLGSPFPAVLQPFPQPFPRARPPPARLRVRKLASPSPHARRPRPPPASAAPATGRGSTGRVGLADNARKAGRAGGPRRVTRPPARRPPLHEGLPGRAGTGRAGCRGHALPTRPDAPSSCPSACGTEPGAGEGPGSLGGVQGVGETAPWGGPAPAPAPFLQPYLGQDGPRGSPSPPCRWHVPVLPLEHRCCRAGEAQGKGSGIHPGARPRPPGKAWPGRHCLPSHPPASSTPAGPGNKRCLSLRSPPLRAAAGPPPRTRLCRERGGPAAAGAHGLCRGPVRAGGQGVAPLCHPHAGRTQIHSVAPLGTAQLRVASWPPGRHGTARKGTAQQGMARHGLPAAAHTDTPWVSSPQGVTGAPAGSPQGPQPGGGRPHGPAGSSVLGQSLPAPGPAHLADNGTPREKYLRTPGKTKGPVTAAGRASRPLPGQPLPGSLLCAPRVPPPKSCPGWGAVAQLPAPPTHRGEEGKAQTLGAWTPTRPLICCVPKHCTSRGGAQHPPTKPLPTVNPGLGPLGGPPGLNPRSLRPPAPRAGSSPPGSSSPGHGLASPQEPAPRGSPAGGYL